MRPLHRLFFLVLALALHCGTSAVAQKSASSALIVEKINDSQLVTLRGNTNPAANAQNDAGRVSSNLAMSDLILVLKRSPEQQAAFDAFVASQYDATSPNFHQWLEPAQIGEKFGPALSDIATVSGWLSGHGLSVDEVSNDHMTIRFSGTAGQVETAFHTEIHHLTVKGEQHIANMSDPQIPMALEPAVAGVKALHNFFPRPLHKMGSKATLNQQTGHWERIPDSSKAVPSIHTNALKLQPDLGITVGSGSSAYQIEDVTPYDFAAIYNVLPLWNASTPIDGTGQTIAIAGTSKINLSDVTSFRSLFGLPAGTAPTMVVANGVDPGICAGSAGNCTIDDQVENALDVEWSGAVAKGAKVVLVVSGTTTPSTDTVFSSASYVVQNNIAKILNVSYGLCELGMGTTQNTAYNNLWQSAASAGIAVFVASGDSGSPACDQGLAPSVPYGATYGLAVSGLASTPYNTAVGGTDLNWGDTAAPYWGASNNANNGSNALGYMPEVPWNDTCTNPLALSYFQHWATQLHNAGYPVINPTDAESACNFVQLWYQTIYSGAGVDLSGFVNTVGAGGGASSCTTSNGAAVSTCSGGYAKPAWQAGVTGIPNDLKRDLPDVSFFASPGFLGSAYLICVSASGPCMTNTSSSQPEPTAQEIGGTSAASPAMAGVMALINQKAGTSQGNPNTELYTLAGKQTYTSCKSETGTVSNGCYFNDVDTGTIAMACEAAPALSPNCTVLYAGDSLGVLSGYSGAVGFDLASGLGSLNVANVVNGWTSSTGTATATVTVVPTPAAITTGQSSSVVVTVAGASGTPTGTIVINSGTFGSATKSLTGGTVTFAIPGSSLVAGANTLTATYSGDPTYAPATGTTSVTVTKLNPTVTVLPASSATNSNVPLTVTGTVTGAGATATGTVTLSGGGYTSPAQTLSGGAYSFTIPANSLSGGVVTLTVNYSGDSTYVTGAGTGSVTVTIIVPLTPTVTVTPTPTSISTGQALSVLVTVSGSGATPTGTVVLSSGGFASATRSLASGTYTFAVPANTLAAGTDTLTAAYSGDTVYSAGTGTAPVTVTASAFTLAASAPAGVTAGGSTTSTITLTSSTSYTGAVILSCALTSSPAGASKLPTCSAASGSTINVSGGTPGGTGSVSVSTTAAVSALVKPRIGSWAGEGAVLALLVFFGIPARRRSWRAMLGMVALMVALGSLAACGGGSSSNGTPGTTIGSYTFTVTGTGSPAVTPAPTTTFTVNVN